MMCLSLKKKDLPLDASLLGLWESVGNDEVKARALISKYSETEYAIRFGDVGGEQSFLRGYPIEVIDVPCIQLFQVDERYMPKPDEPRYYVISYEFSGGELVFKIFTGSGDLKSSMELRNAFIKNKDDNESFSSGARYRKVSTNESQ